MTPEKRELKRQIRELKRQVIPTIKKRIAAAKKAKARRLAEVRAECKRRGKEAKKRAAQSKMKLKTAIAAMRKRGTVLCAHECKAVDTMTAAELAAAHSEFEAAVKKTGELMADYRHTEPKNPRRQAAGRRGAEVKGEREDEVRRDVEDNPELLALWTAHKHHLPPKPRMTRTEVFFEWLHYHPEALDELRAKKENQYEKELNAAFAGRVTQSADQTIEELQEEIERLKFALVKCERPGTKTRKAAPAAVKPLKKSKGHIAFNAPDSPTRFEFYQREGQIYRASIPQSGEGDVFDADGYRGGRWESSREHFDRNEKLIVGPGAVYPF